MAISFVLRESTYGFVSDQHPLFNLPCYFEINFEFVSYHTVDVNPIMTMDVGERKYTVENIVPIFKFYERTYAHIYFDWLVVTFKLYNFCRIGPDVFLLIARKG